MFERAARSSNPPSEAADGALVDDGKLVALGRLAPGVAHEINNPLFAILGFAEFLLAEAEPGTKAHERLTLVHQSGLEIKEIVRALLEFAREPSDGRRVVSLADVVRTTVELVHRTTPGAGPDLVVRYCEDDLAVDGNPNQLKQLLLHELARAQAAAGEGGTVAVELSRLGDRAEVGISTRPGGAAGDFGGGTIAARAGAEIARAHGGELVASPEGAVLRIPLAGEAGRRHAAEAA